MPLHLSYLTAVFSRSRAKQRDRPSRISNSLASHRRLWRRVRLRLSYLDRSSVTDGIAAHVGALKRNGPRAREEGVTVGPLKITVAGADVLAVTAGRGNRLSARLRQRN